MDPYVEVALQAQPSPDYMPSPEEPEQAPPSPDYSPEYVPESDFEMHPENDDDEDPEEDPVDYHVDGGDDGDEEDESSEDEEDDEMDVEADEEEEEHPTPADSVAAASTSPPPSQLPSTSRREDTPEVTLPPHKRLDIALGPRYKVGDSSSAAAARPAGGFRADYGFVAAVDREIMPPVSTDTKLGGYVREFETRVRQDMDEIYTRLDDEQTERHLLAGWLNMLFRDRRAHAYTCQLMETEARMSKEAWARVTDASDLVHGETVILELLRMDHRRSTETSESRTALQGQITALQGQVTALQAQVATLQGQQGLARYST
nr:hypothetical protein [Tanacetum cinerariifolium]